MAGGVKRAVGKSRATALRHDLARVGVRVGCGVSEVAPMGACRRSPPWTLAFRSASSMLVSAALRACHSGKNGVAMLTLVVPVRRNGPTVSLPALRSGCTVSQATSAYRRRATFRSCRNAAWMGLFSDVETGAS